MGIFVGVSTFKNLFYPEAYQEIVHKYALENDLDECLVMSVIKTESNFVPDAYSGKASGLMQLTDATAEWVCERVNIDVDKINLYNPRDNIKLGCYYLKYLIDMYDGNIDVALAAYNAGPGKVNDWLGDDRYSLNGVDLLYVPYKETREYIVKVNEQWKRYTNLYEKNKGEEK